jgi:hypothetical protein
VPDRHPHGVFDQGQHGDADSGVAQDYFSGPFEPFARILARQDLRHDLRDKTRRDDPHRDRSTMKAPVVLVTVALSVAILLAASFLIATGTRGENALRLRSDDPASQSLPTSPAAR